MNWSEQDYTAWQARTIASRVITHTEDEQAAWPQAMNLTASAIASMQTLPEMPGVSQARARVLPNPYANGLEADYAALLERRKRIGEILDWRYEPFRIILADRTTYQPDFFIVAPDRTLEFHETKGWFREDARVKVKVVARMFPWFKFVVVTRPSKRQGWKYEEVKT